MRFFANTSSLHSTHFSISPLDAKSLSFWTELRNHPESFGMSPWQKIYTESDGQEMIEQNETYKPRTYETSLIIYHTQQRTRMGEFYFKLDPIDNSQIEFYLLLHPDYLTINAENEICSSLFSYLFSSCKIHKIRTLVDSNNQFLVQTFERLGMTREAHFVENRLKNGAWHDEFLYGSLKSEWIDSEVSCFQFIP